MDTELLRRAQPVSLCSRPDQQSHTQAVAKLLIRCAVPPTHQVLKEKAGTVIRFRNIFILMMKSPSAPIFQAPPLQ